MQIQAGTTSTRQPRAELPYKRAAEPQCQKAARVLLAELSARRMAERIIRRLSLPIDSLRGKLPGVDGQHRLLAVVEGTEADYRVGFTLA